MCKETKPKLNKCPVPWCDGDGVVMKAFFTKPPYAVVCQKCKASTPPYETIEQAVAVWNQEPLGDKVVHDGDTWSEDTAKGVIENWNKKEIPEIKLSRHPNKDELPEIQVDGKGEPFTFKVEIDGIDKGDFSKVDLDKLKNRPPEYTPIQVTPIQVPGKPEMIKGRIEDVEHLPDGKMNLTLAAADGSQKWRILGAVMTKSEVFGLHEVDSDVVKVETMPFYSWGKDNIDSQEESKVEVDCGECDGLGTSPDLNGVMTPCDRCKGTGKVKV